MRVEPALITTLLLPIWEPMERHHVENPGYDFIERFIEGQEPVLWTKKIQTVMTNDPVWLRECCRAVANLSREELCVMHVYTTQAYAQVTQFLRGVPVKKLGLIYDSLHEWRAGEIAMRDNIRLKNRSRFLTPSVDPRKLDALLSAWREPRSEEQFKVCWECFSALRPNFTPKFLRICKTLSVRNHSGVVFAAQAEQPLVAFEKAIPQMRSQDWHRIMIRFVADLDAIFVKMPQCHKAFYVYRGEGKLGQRSHLSFISTSLDQDSARHFAKPTLLRITVPAGSRVLPLLCISRYKEQELLLPRGFNALTGAQAM